MNNAETKFKHWCIVELFGHQKIAGYCTEENIAGSNMLRVDVPETKSQPAFTKYFGAAAIYAINPVDENTSRIAAESISVAPVQMWQGEKFIEKFNQSKPQLENSSQDHFDVDLEDDDFETEHDD